MRRIQKIATAMALAAAMLPGALRAETAPAWKHESAAGVEFAYLSGKNAELAVRCKAGAVEVVYYLSRSALDAPLQGRTDAIFAVLLDDEQDLQWVQSTLVVDGDVVSAGMGGIDANSLAHSIASAKTSIGVSLFLDQPSPTATAYNSARFPVTGAADAIKAAFAGCGLQF